MGSERTAATGIAELKSARVVIEYQLREVEKLCVISAYFTGDRLRIRLYRLRI